MPRQQQTKSTKARDFTFGVEIECMIPNRTRIPVGNYHNPRLLNGDFPEGWMSSKDSSIAQYVGYKGVEFISPILKGEDGLNQVMSVLDKLNELGAKVNRTCGFHVHVGAKSVAGPLADDVAGWVNNLIHLVGQHETALYASTGSRFRAKECRFTKSIHARYDSDKRKELKKKKWDVLQRQVSGIDRYRTLNLANLFNSKMTAEFRVFAGTLSKLKVLGHIQMVLGLCEKALGTCVSFNPPATQCYKGGDGLKSLNRLYFLLGWTLGRKDVGQPTCSAFGWIADLDKMKGIRKELRRLAEKFDSNV